MQTGDSATPDPCQLLAAVRRVRAPLPSREAEQYDGVMTTTVNGTCHHDCPDSCGWTVTVDDGAVAGRVAVKLRGNPDHPYS